MSMLSLFATAPKGLELLLVDELRALGATDPAEKLAGVAFSGDLTLAYKTCLWSRLANRVLLTLTTVPAATPEALYEGVQTIKWDQHLREDGTLAVHCVCVQSAITHSLFAAQKVKDAIVDQLRDQYGVRPDVSRVHPDVSIYIYLFRDQAVISLDLSGDSLHRRGYRLEGGSAPLKENLAAAILQRANWPAIAKTGAALMDPMCGSGTLLIEGALIAGDIAPGLQRDYFGFLGWKKHKSAIWETLRQEAEQRAQVGMKSLPPLVGYDQNPEAITIAFENIKRAGLLGHIHVEKRDLSVFAPKAQTTPGLVATNPPYGERLGEVEELRPLYSLLGEKLKTAFEHWKAAVFTGNPDLGKQMGLRARKYYALFNGPIPCKLLLFDVEPENYFDRSPEADNERRIRAAQRAVGETRSPAVEMFINRLRKNMKHRLRTTQRDENTSVQLYDADLPEYAFVIELKNNTVLVQEYEAPRKVPEEKVLQRRHEVLAVLPEVLEVAPSTIYFEIIPK